jgi:hypothetical protein
MNYRYYDEQGQHLHTLNDRPLLGTSTVVGVIAKPLTWWASGLAVGQLGWIKPLDKRKKPTEEEVDANTLARQKSALTMLEKFSAMTPEEYCKLLDKAYRAHADTLSSAADTGTDMHAELEGYVKLCIENYGGTPQPRRDEDCRQVQIFASWARENVKRFIVSEGHCYSERLWTGGITDCIAELNDGRFIIIDFKSSKEAYTSQFIQAAGYDIEASEHGILDTDGNLLLKLERPIDGYAIFPFGAEQVEPQFRFDTEELRAAFEAATVLHKIINSN